MVNILNKLIFLFFTFLVLSMLNSRLSFSKILDIKTPAKQAIIYIMKLIKFIEKAPVV